LWVRKQENQNDCSAAKLLRAGGLYWRSAAIAVQRVLNRAFFDIVYVQSHVATRLENCSFLSFETGRPTERDVFCSENSGLCSEGAWFESRSGQQLFWSWPTFPWSLQAFCAYLHTLYSLLFTAIQLFVSL
jgi:hypothetical protein